MEYKPLTFPLPPEVEADLCDPGSPPEGHVRVAVLRFSEESTAGNYIAATGPNFTADMFFALGLQDDDHTEDPTSYRTGFCMPEILDSLQEWEP